MSIHKIISHCLLVVLLVSLVGCGAAPSSGVSSSGSNLSGAAVPGSASSSSLVPFGVGGTWGQMPGGDPMDPNVPLNFDPLDILRQGEYTMGLTIHLTYPDFSYTLTREYTETGGDLARRTAGDVPMTGYTETRYIAKDAYEYWVDDVAETYTQDERYWDEEDAPGFDLMELAADLGEQTGSGEAEFNGYVCTYIEYAGEYGPGRAYFNMEGILVGVTGPARTMNAALDGYMYGESVTIIDYISPIIAGDFFEIPSHYERIDDD